MIDIYVADNFKKEVPSLLEADEYINNYIDLSDWDSLRFFEDGKEIDVIIKTILKKVEWLRIARGGFKMRVQVADSWKFKDWNIEHIVGKIEFLYEGKWYSRTYTTSTAYPHYYIFRFKNELYRVQR